MDRRRTRDVVVALLDRLPDPWFVWLRDRYAREGRGHLRGRVLEPLVGISRHRRLPVDGFALDDHPELRLEATDSIVAKRVYWYGAGGYEGAEGHYWRRACRRATGVLELGANVGYYTLLGASANPECRYRAVEPHPGSAAALRRNVAANALTNVEVIEAAAVGRRATTHLQLSVPVQDRYELPAGAFVREGGEGVDHLATRKSFTVDAVAMEDLLDGIDLLKIDIEGHEADVLEPVMDDLLRASSTVFLEVRRAALPRLRRVVMRFATAGYLVFAIGADSLHLVTHAELESEDRLPRYGNRDLVLVPALEAGKL